MTSVWTSATTYIGSSSKNLGRWREIRTVLALLCTQQIEEVELGLRQLVERKLKAKFGDSAENIMKRILGEKHGAQSSRQKSEVVASTGFRLAALGTKLMPCMYIGQLGTLMVSGRYLGSLQGSVS